MMKPILINEDVTLMAPVPMPKNFKGNFAQKRDYEIHPGTDIPVPSGTEVKAPMDGTVENISMTTPLCGGTIDIDYGNGFWSRFCHIKRIDVSKGSTVKQGEIVGLSGGGANDEGKGNSGGPHLHFTLKKDGVKVNPVDYIDKTVPSSSVDNSQVADIASKIGKDPEMSYSQWKALNPGEKIAGMLQKGIEAVFSEEVKRIKQLMK